jgi:hypothetical protein
MEVNLKFNTEKEDLNELKKLQTWVTEIIAKREAAVSARIEQQKQEASQPKPAPQPTPSYSSPKPAEPKKQEYSGHGRMIEFEDLTDAMSKIYSGGKL